MFKKITLLFLLAYASSSYADASCFTGGDSTITSILSGCPAGDQLLAIVGACPNNITSQAQDFCNSQGSRNQADQDACKKLYMSTYYGKLQTACNYLIHVQQADLSYVAPPPLSDKAPGP